jgi:NAD(P)H-flavin reductase
MSGCETHVVAIALDGAFPEGPGGRSAGHQRLGIFGRRLEGHGTAPVSLTGTDDGHSSAASGPASEKAAQSEIPGSLRDAPRSAATEFADFNAQLVKETFAHVMADAQKAMEYFYARLFVQSPEVRALFPLAMSEVREQVFAALARLIWSLDSPESAVTYLGQLGRDHRRFGVKDKHHKAFFDALLATVEHFSGAEWTAEAAAAWAAALDGAAGVMRAAAGADAARQPPWWLGEVVRHDHRAADVAVLTIRPDQPLSYIPGQYLGIQVARWPRVWRNFSVANAPRDSGLLDLHVKAVPGGMVSNALVHRASAGDTLLLGQAGGTMTAPDDSGRDLLCVAGGTGLAPLKAIIESVIGHTRFGQRRNITLFVGAQRKKELYDMRDLQALQSGYPSLTVVPVVSHEPGFAGIKGLLPQVVRRHASLQNADVFISGPDRMVTETRRVLADRVPADRIHHDPLNAATSSRYGALGP